MLSGVNRLIGESMSRIVLLIEMDGDDFGPGFVLDGLTIVELRVYDMKDHEQCARQFVREMVIQSRPIDQDRQLLVVIGGDMIISPLPGAEQIPLQTVPFTIWSAVPPSKPQWDVKAYKT